MEAPIAGRGQDNRRDGLPPEPEGGSALSALFKEVADLAKTIEGKDKKNFVSAFDRLTASCNACHQASKKDFIRIQRPTGNPYTNQSFAPPRK